MMTMLVPAGISSSGSRRGRRKATGRFYRLAPECVHGIVVQLAVECVESLKL